MNDSNKTTFGDAAYNITKGLIGAVPIGGSLAAEIFGMLIVPPLESRRKKWMEEVAAKLQQLQDSKEIDFAQLRDNEQFIDVVYSGNLIRH